MTLINALRQEWDGPRSAYKKHAHGDVVKYSYQYRETGKYPYLSDVIEYIVEQEGLQNEPAHLIDNLLGWHVYYSNQVIREEQAKIEAESLKLQGYTQVTMENAGSFVGEKVYAIDTEEGMFKNSRKKQAMKFNKFDGVYVLMAPNARVSGWEMNIKILEGYLFLKKR